MKIYLAKFYQKNGDAETIGAFPTFGWAEQARALICKKNGREPYEKIGVTEFYNTLVDFENDQKLKEAERVYNSLNKETQDTLNYLYRKNYD